MVLQKLRDGSLICNPRPFSIHKLVDQVTASQAELMESHGVKLICEIDSKMPSLIIGDKKHISHILSNLLKNAIQHSSVNSSVLLSIGRTSGIASETIFNVTDNGSLISELQCDAIFEPFKLVTHEENGKSRRNIELSICKELVFVCGGLIGLSSRITTNSNGGNIPTNTFQVFQKE